MHKGRKHVHIPVVEDDDLVRDLLEVYLGGEDYRVTAVHNGSEMRAAISRSTPDLVLMDLRLPGDDGLMLTRYLREHHNVGIIILTARGNTADRVAGLECGADDYIVKPFAGRELLARIRSLLRRTTNVPRLSGLMIAESAICFHGCQPDPAAGRFRSAGGDEVALTYNETRLLEHLVRHSGRVMSRDELMTAVLQRAWDPCDRSIDVLVTRLRHKIEADPKRPRIIRTMRGSRYLVAADATDTPHTIAS